MVGVVRGHAVDGDGKTDHSVRTTVAALRAHREMQKEEKAAFGPGYQDGGHVFGWEDGRLHPECLRARAPGYGPCGG